MYEEVQLTDPNETQHNSKTLKYYYILLKYYYIKIQFELFQASRPINYKKYLVQQKNHISRDLQDTNNSDI